MIHTATLAAPEPVARAVVDALAEDEALWPLAVDLSETGPGAWRVMVYLDGKPDRATLAGLGRVAEAVAGGAAWTTGTVADQDWVAKSLEGLPPVRAGRFLVHGGHDRGKVRPNDIGIEIEAGQAFGTGHHGTTAGCLIAIDRVAKARAITNALDIGTGSGVLAIAIARRTGAPVLATDIDPVAVTVARANQVANGTADRVTTIEAGTLRGRQVSSRAPFDLIVANILAGPLMALAPSIRQHLAPGGTLILSGLLPAQRRAIVATYRGQGLRLVRSAILDGWLTVVFARPQTAEPAR